MNSTEYVILPVEVLESLKDFDNWKEFKNNSDFFHITIKILSGRSKEIRYNLSKKVLEKISPNLSDYKKLKGLNSETGFSVLIEEMDKEVYQKIVV